MTTHMFIQNPRIESDDSSTSTTTAARCSLLKIPAEIGNAIFDLLLIPPTTINLNRIPQKPYLVIEELGPLSLTCKAIWARVLDWYAGNKSKYNLTKTATFGQIDLDRVDYTLHVFNHAIGLAHPVIEHAPLNDCDGTLCPCQIHRRFLPSDMAETSIIRGLGLFLAG